MKRTQRPSSSPALPTVRALPPQRRRLTDTPGVRPALRVAGGVAIALLILGGAAGAVIALERGILPRVAIPLASLSVIAATAAYLAGRAEGKQQNSSVADRKRAKGRLQKGAPTAGRRGAADQAASTTPNAGAMNAAVASHLAATALRTKFLDDISQALRAPITSICLAARIIRKHYDSTPEVVAHFGDTLLAEADRLGQTVDEFLELARLESGLIEWHEDEVDAADLIQRAVAEVESVAVSYGVSVAFTMEPALPPMHVDRERVTQALTILLAMSVRAASEGSEIVIQIAGAHGGWVFTVGGTSFVYPHSEARKVHVRADGAPPIEQPEARPDGMGLGLCLCREIVARYQGRFWIEGTPGTAGCARFTVPYRQHRRATATTTAAASTTTAQSERPQIAAQPEPIGTPAEQAAPGDLEQRREMAVKVLRDRAASQPRVEATEAAQASTENSKHSTGEESVTPAKTADANAAAAASAAPADKSTTTSAEATPTSAANSPQPATPETSATGRPGAKISFGRRQAGTESETTVTPQAAQAPIAKSEPAVSPTSEAAPTASASVAEIPSAAASESDDAVEVEIEIDDAPVHAPVSGTMITATHRTAGPPVLASPGVPALSGVQSAANAAMQGSDELLLEIAEAQSPDGRSLVVSEEVRSLLASAPGTLPAVAGQNAPAVAGRGAYTPSRRRMVQAPWVVRAGEGQPAGADAQAEPTPAQSADASGGGQRARLNERLAKRLGLTGSSQSAGPGGKPGGSGSGSYARSRRIG